MPARNTGYIAPHDNSIRYGVYACEGCTSPFVALKVDEPAERFKGRKTKSVVEGIPNTVESEAPATHHEHFGEHLGGHKSFIGHPVFQCHVDFIQWLDHKLSLRSYAKEVVIDFTGDVQYPSPILWRLLFLLVPIVLLWPICLFVFIVRAASKYGCHREILPLLFSLPFWALSYVSLFCLVKQNLITSQVKFELSFIELFGCPTIVVLLCLALLVEIFLLRVEDAAAVQVREQLLACPQAVYSTEQDSNEADYSDLHGLISLLRHMSKSLRQHSDMTSIFQFSVIEQILRSDSYTLHRAHISTILENMRNATRGEMHGPSRSANLALAENGREPLTLAWQCYAKYRKVGIRSHAREFGSIAALAAFVALSPALVRWRHGGAIIPRFSGAAAAMLAVTYIFIVFFGVCSLMLLVAHSKHRFSHLKRCLVVILYISGTPRFRPALHSSFFNMLKDIVVTPDGKKKNDSVNILDIETTDESEATNREAVESFSRRFLKQRELNNVGDEKVSVKFPTLAVNKFFLLRTTVRTVVAVERLRQQMIMMAIFVCMLICVAICFLPLTILHRNPTDLSLDACLGFTLFCLSMLPLGSSLNEAVQMNNIMQKQSTSGLKAWGMEIQEVHWTLQNHYRLFPVSEARLLLDNYFRGLLEPYSFMVKHIRESEKPISFCGMAVTAQKRNQILGTIGSSGFLYLCRLLSDAAAMHEKADGT